MTLTGERVRYLLPPELHIDAFNLAHEAAMAGHMGMEATLARVATHFWWPTIKRDVMLMVKTCPDCVQKITKERVKDGIHVPSRQGYPQQVLFIDLVGPLPKTPELDVPGRLQPPRRPLPHCRQEDPQRRQHPDEQAHRHLWLPPADLFRQWT